MKLQHVAEMYSADAEPYAARWAPALLPQALQLIERLPVRDARAVLDAGAGVGILLPELERVAPNATIVGIDCAHGMLARAPARFPRAVMALERPGLAPGGFDVVVSAFVLFHLAEPADGLRAIHRLLRPGGSIGTITWDGEPRFPAQRVWNEALDAHGAAPGRSLLNHAPVCSPDAMRARFDETGYDANRTWTGRFEFRYDPEELIAMRTRRGTSRRRFESLTPAGRDSLLRDVRARFAAMQPEDFVDRSRPVFATAVSRP